jgi:hypothetical protein
MPLTSGSVTKYRLGAPAQIWLNYNLKNQYDVGTSMGGVVFSYKPTYFDAIADQAIAAVQRWRTEEHADVVLSLPEVCVTNMLIAMGYTAGSDTATASGTQAVGGTITLTVNGTPGTTGYSYQIAAINSNGDGIPPTAVAATTGAATLTSVNSITINLPTAPAGATGFRIIRSASAGTPASTGLIGTVADNATSFTDTGIVATAYTPSAAQPATPATDSFTLGGQVYVPAYQLDVAVPRNDGSGLNWRYRFWSVTADGTTAIDWKRDKNSEISLTLSCLANLGQATGAFFGKITDEISSGALA